MNDDRESVRRDVAAWLTEHWDPEQSLLDWRRRLTDAGWTRPSWPSDWHGRGLPAWADEIVATEIAHSGAVGAPIGSGMALAAPTILAHGSDEAKQLLYPTLTGECTWCQLFSEPGSGSDLAGLSTRADRDGDEWIVNGQKLWSTSAHHADYGMLLARTDADVPKHRGITYFALPMDQPGVEARPLRQMNGHASFNEVFLTDACVPDRFRVGAAGEGWRAAMTTLAHERGFGAMRRPATYPSGGRAHREAQAEADDHFRTYEWYPQRAGRADLLVERAGAAAVGDDAIVRQRIAATLSSQRAQQWTAQRATAARALGRAPGAEGSIGKLGTSIVARAAAMAHGQIAGAAGMLAAPDGDAIVAEILVSVPAQSIAGGTDEIQHNILGEQLLGLPREPSVDRELPFRDIPRSV
jgi:alkylation response protein AidB-like acyl-CoA dehydrogenase